jgi:hypothetical protein
MAKNDRVAADSSVERLLGEACKIATAPGKMFVPICEVILYDQCNPETSIMVVEGAFCGRKVGDHPRGSVLPGRLVPASRRSAELS